MSTLLLAKPHYTVQRVLKIIQDHSSRKMYSLEKRGCRRRFSQGCRLHLRSWTWLCSSEDSMTKFSRPSDKPLHISINTFKTPHPWFKRLNEKVTRGKFMRCDHHSTAHRLAIWNVLTCGKIQIEAIKKAIGHAMKIKRMSHSNDIQQWLARPMVEDLEGDDWWPVMKDAEDGYIMWPTVVEQNLSFQNNSKLRDCKFKPSSI